MTELRIELYRHLSDTDKTFWISALCKDYFGSLSIPWSEAVRAAAPASVELHYLQVFSGERRLALAVLHVLRGLDLGGYMGGRAKSLSAFVARSGWTPLAKDLAFLEVPLANSSGLRLAPGSEDLAEQIVGSLLQFIRQEFRYHVLCIKLSSDEPYEGTLEGMRLLKTSFLANMAIQFQGERSFSEYLKRISPRTRTQSRSYSRTFAMAGGTIEILEHFDDALFASMNRLYARTLQHHAEVSNLQLTIPLGSGFFRSLTGELPGAARVFLAKIEGEPVGFFLVLYSGEHAYFTHCGLDYERSVPTRAYFNLYYAIVADSIDRRIERLHLGAEAYTTKQRIGAIASPTRYYAEVRNPLLRVVASLVARNFESQEGAQLLDAPIDTK